MSKELTTPTNNKPLWARLTEVSESIKEQYPDHAKLVALVAKQEIIALGENEMFTLRDATGEIRAFKQSVTFSLSAGTLVQPVPNGPLVVSAQGYEVWQETAGASVIFPKEVLVDGKWEPNPAVVRDPQNRRILCIYARAVAFRFSSKGIPIVTDWSHCFDLPSYRLIDLLGKAKKYPQAFKLLPNNMKTPDDPGTWAVYPFDESTSLWVNTSHDEALTWFAQILNREKKALDFAQTFARRNALKHLSGLQKAAHDNWRVAVISWRPTGRNVIKWDATEYAHLQETVGNLITSRGDEFQSCAQIEYKKGSDRASDDDHGVVEFEQAPDGEDQEAQGVVTSTEQPGNGEDPNLTVNFEETKNQFPDEYRAACRQLQIPESGPFTGEGMKAIITLIEKMV